MRSRFCTEYAAWHFADSEVFNGTSTANYDHCQMNVGHLADCKELSRKCFQHDKAKVTTGRDIDCHFHAGKLSQYFNSKNLRIFSYQRPIGLI